MTRLTACALAAFLLAAGCAPRPPTRESHVAAAAAAACRARTDQIYARQNRYLLSERDTRDSPFSSQGLPGITSAGLSQRFDRDSIYDNCIGSNAPDQSDAPAFAPGQTPTGSFSNP